MRAKHSLLKKAIKKIVPVIIVGITALTPDQAVHAPNITVDQTPPPASAERGRQSFKPSVTIIDAGLTSPTDRIIQKEFPPSSDELVKKLLEDKDVSEQQREMLNKFFDTYFSHGQDVARAMEGTFSKLGLQSTGIELVPLQNSFNKEDVKFVTDSFGNPGVSINFDSQKIIGLLRNDPNRIINMSFQVGNVEMFREEKYISIPEPKSIYGDGVNSAIGDQNGNVYIGAVGYGIINGKTMPVDTQGREVKPTTPEEQKVLWKRAREEARKNARIKEAGIPLTKIAGAYERSKALENLPKLFEVAKAYPGKLFFAAAGNEGEDLREALVKIGNERPNNLILVAEWSSSYPRHGVYGADMYVDNYSLGVPEGSSFSTPVLAAYAVALFDRGMTLEQIREKILAASEIKTYERYWIDDIKGEARVFDPQRLN